MTAMTMEKPMEIPTTRRRLDDELEAIRAKLLSMSCTAGQMLSRAVDALESQDAAAAALVIEQDETIDDLDRDIEAEALLLLATQQPIVAFDLRFLSAVLKVITDLERIGDHAVNIAKSTQQMVAECVSYEAVTDFRRFVVIAREMLGDAMRAFIEHDAALAHAVIERDDEADVLYSEAQRELRKAMPPQGSLSDPVDSVRASYLLFVAHDLERVCDHCTNIAERVIFSETGEVIVPERGHQEWKS